MKVLVGLGNPGPRYKHTRHNVGFLAIDRAAETLGVAVTREKYDGLVAEATWQGQKVLLLKPQTFMNRSGRAVVKAVQNAMDDYADLLVLTDDVHLPLGKLRIRSSGSAGGHNGLKSIIEALGTQAFPRLRMGVGHSVSSAALSGHVLGTFRPDEYDAVSAMVDRAAEAALLFVGGGLVRAMNQFN